MLKYLMLALLFYGCGPSGSCDTNKETIIEEESSTNEETTVEVQRGDVYNAIVIDSNGQKAIWDIYDNNNTLSNKYTFKEKVKYPIYVSGGIIDINQDFKIDTNDTKLDINMSSNTNIITPISTFLVNASNTQKEVLNQYIDLNFNLNINDIDKYLPSSYTTNELSILNNALYLNIKKNNFELNTTILDDIKSKAEQNSSLNSKDMLKYLETYIIDTQNIQTLNEDEILDFNTQISKIKNVISLNNGYFSRQVKTTNTIEDIWNFTFKINNKSEEPFDLAVKISKESGAFGTIVFNNNQLINNTFSSAKTMSVYFKSSTGSSLSKTYDGVRFMPIENSIDIYENYLLINFANIMLSDDFNEYLEKFTAQGNYKVEIFIKGGLSILNDQTLSSTKEVEIYNDSVLFPNDSHIITADLNISN